MMLTNMLTGKNSGCEGKSNSDNQRYSRGMQTDTSDHAACQTVEQVGQNHTSCCSWRLTSGNWSSLEEMLPELMSPFEAALLCVRLMVWRPTLHHQHRLSLNTTGYLSTATDHVQPCSSITHHSHHCNQTPQSPHPSPQWV